VAIIEAEQVATLEAEPPLGAGAGDGLDGSEVTDWSAVGDPVADRGWDEIPSDGSEGLALEDRVNRPAENQAANDDSHVAHEPSAADSSTDRAEDVLAEHDARVSDRLMAESWTSDDADRPRAEVPAPAPESPTATDGPLDPDVVEAGLPGSEPRTAPDGRPVRAPAQPEPPGAELHTLSDGPPAPDPAPAQPEPPGANLLTLSDGPLAPDPAPAQPEPPGAHLHTLSGGPLAADPAPAQPESLGANLLTLRDGPLAPDPLPAPARPGEPEPGPLTAPDGPPAEPATVPDMPVSPAPAGPLPDMPPLEAAPGSVGDEVAAELAAQTPAPDAQAAPRTPEAGEWRGIVLVTGTDTDVGKTIVTSAIAAAAQAAGLRVAVIKPGQTGTSDGAPTDIDLVNRLAAPHTARTLASYPEPLAPLAAARVAHLPPLELYEVVDAVRSESAKHDLVLVEGAGGLLVPMGVRPSGEPWTLADLATTLGVSTIVVSRAGLGTLNHTALTLEALARRGIPAGVVLGAWPAEPELVHWANLSELLPHLVGALPDGAGAMDPGVFRRSAPGWLTPALYGVLDDWRVWADEVR
jgi:dethiobiotin synthetase